MKIIKKWLKKHWLHLALVVLIITLWGTNTCSEAAYKRDIKLLDDEIAEKVADNVKKDEIIEEAKEQAIKAEGVVAEKEANIEASGRRIRELEKKETKIVDMVAALPPSAIVGQLREVLQCAAVELTDAGVLFSEECARMVLVEMKKFNSMKKRLAETEFSLSESLAATQFQKIATWNVYKIAWAQGTQIMNYQDMVKALDLKFERCEKQRKKGYWNGLKLGLAIGAGITITFTLIIPVIKAIF
jgi:hypothetical protein